MIKNFVLIFTLLLQSVVFGQEFSKTQQPYLPVNYIKNAGGESGVTGYNLYADAAGTTPVDGTGGSPTITITSSTTTPLEGGRSLVIFKPSGSSHQGQGVSTDFTISNLDKGKVLQASLSYQVTAGTYADDDISWYIYDVTNARVIAPAPSKQKNSGIIEKFNFEFQSSIDSTSYRLIGHISSTSTATYTVKYDSFVVGSQPKVYGSVATDTIDIVPTGTWVSNTTYSGKVTRLGSYAKFDLKVTLSGAPNAVTLDINLPAGYAIDTTKLANPNNNNFNLGSLNVIDNSAGIGYTGIVRLLSPTSVRLHPSGTAGSFVDINSGLNASTPITFATSDIIDINFTVPIVGWSSSQVMSSDANTRVVLFSGYVASNQALTASVTNLPLTASKDSHAAWTGSTYVVPTPGDYQIAATLLANATGGTIQAYVNAAAVKQMMTINTAEYVSAAITLENLKAGDIISFRSNATQTVAGVSTAFVSISRISGPSQIAASESVSALYTGAPATGTFNSSFNTVTYGTKVKDSHNAYSGGVYTIPTSGVYDISAQLLTLTTLTANQLVQLGVSINGAAPTYKAYYNATAAASNALVPLNIKSIPLLAGQTVAIQALTEGTTNSFSSTAGNSYFSITRTGQY